MLQNCSIQCMGYFEVGRLNFHKGDDVYIVYDNSESTEYSLVLNGKFWCHISANTVINIIKSAVLNLELITWCNVNCINNLYKTFENPESELGEWQEAKRKLMKLFEEKQGREPAYNSELIGWIQSLPL